MRQSLPPRAQADPALVPPCPQCHQASTTSLRRPTGNQCSRGDTHRGGELPLEGGRGLAGWKIQSRGVAHPELEQQRPGAASAASMPVRLQQAGRAVLFILCIKVSLCPCFRPPLALPRTMETGGAHQPLGGQTVQLKEAAATRPSCLVLCRKPASCQISPWLQRWAGNSPCQHKIAARAPGITPTQAGAQSQKGLSLIRGSTLPHTSLANSGPRHLCRILS